MLLPGAQEMDLGDALASLARDGYARLGRVLDGGAARALGERADDLMLGRVSYPGMFFQADSATGRYQDLAFGEGWQGPGLGYRKIEKLEKDPLFLAWLSNALFERIARALIAGDVALYRAVLFAKSVDGGTALPWHQDGGHFWGVDRDPTLQIWTALDDIPVEAGCVEIVPRSHLRGLATPQGGVIPDTVLDRFEPERRAVSLPAVAGEVILIHNHAWHRSGVNRSGRPRRALTACYMSAATRCLRKKRAPRKFFGMWQAREV